jgi:hypothetical protein
MAANLFEGFGKVTVLVPQLKTFRVQKDNSLRLNLDEVNAFLADKSREARDGLGPEVVSIDMGNVVVRYYVEVASGE